MEVSVHGILQARTLEWVAISFSKPHVQEAVAVRVQEGREELLHVQGQEERP